MVGGSRGSPGTRMEWLDAGRAAAQTSTLSFLHPGHVSPHQIQDPGLQLWLEHRAYCMATAPFLLTLAKEDEIFSRQHA